MSTEPTEDPQQSPRPEKPSSPRVHVDSASTTWQSADGDRGASFIKEIVHVEGQEPLALVRKRLPEEALGGRPYAAPLLLLHGFGQNRRAWHLPRRSFVNHLAQEGYDVFNVDLRGHGRSLALGAKRARSLDEYIQQDLPTALDAIAELSGRSRVFGLGHSIGGLVVHSAAALHPERFAGVVALAPPYLLGHDHPTLSTLLQLLHRVTRTGILRGSQLRFPVDWVGKAVHWTRHLWDHPTLPIPVRAWHPRSFEPEDLVTYIAHSFDGASLGTLEQLAALAASGELHSRDGAIDYHEQMEHCQLPLLVVAGSEDRLVNPEAVRPAFERSTAPDKRFETVPCGHGDLLVGNRAPETTWPLVSDWLRERSQPLD